MPENEAGLYFPLFVDIRNRNFLVVGGGRIAARRIRTLLQFKCRIRVIAPEICSEISSLCPDENLLLEERKYADSDLDHADYCLAATDDRELNAEIARQAGARKIPVNDCSCKENCDFYFPGIVTEGPVVIGICASGADHRLAASVTEKVRNNITEDSAERQKGKKDILC